MKVPIACTLTATDAADRIVEWRQFLGDCVAVAERADHGLRLRLKPDDSTLLRAADLAAREKTCCAFFSFAVEIDADARVLVIEVPVDASDVLDEFAGLVPTNLFR